MRFLHTADWQLGMTRHFLAGDAQPRYSAARRDAVAGLGALAAIVARKWAKRHRVQYCAEACRCASPELSVNRPRLAVP